MSVRPREPGTRGQSHVVGVVLLLGITAVSLGGLTAVVGTVVDGQTAAADEARVASAFDDGLRPSEQTGPNRVRVQFTEGRLTTVDRDLRIWSGAPLVYHAEIDGLVYTSGESRASFVGGSVVSGPPGSAALVRGPPITVTRDDSTVVLGVATLNESGVSVGGRGGVSATIRTNVTHDHRQLASDDYAIAVETATPVPLSRHFERVGARTRVRDIDGDGVPSVVVTTTGQQTIELVVHEMHTEVGSG
ncbi:DUF7289 family protein [Haloarcula marina]|uniref:DUF7289 family protein n=1 Tax=Haloarcula marina TaxID=2961574 RepID=UPI0020B70090|nr:type IV pilin [Halomicroarcula marina]